ncbi:putative membrane protein [Helicobacter pylori Hp P-13b]|uniref:Membrane protein n=1 Tax=Helicobacter pylori Hp P-13b TaxID=992107 RepID=A0ABC9QTW0_HELPX|nr:putative membrane protein [Helicobacter pylori Hp P-13b]
MIACFCLGVYSLFFYSLFFILYSFILLFFYSAGVVFFISFVFNFFGLG